MKSIKTKILRSFLAVSIISLAIAGLFSEISMFSLRSITNDSNARIGSEAAGSGMAALTEQAVGDITRLAEAKAQVIDEQMSQVAKSLGVIASYVNHLYTSPGEFKPLPYSHAKDCPDGELTMQWVLSPGMKLEDVMEETYLHGNMKSVYDAVMKSNPGVSSIYLTTETGINSGYDAYAALKPEEFEGRSSPWYVNARDSGALVISDTYRDVFGRGLTVSMSMPCYDGNGRFVGVAGLDMLIENLNENILQTTVGESGYALLLKGGEKIISAPGLTPENERDMEWFIGDAADEILPSMSGRPSGAIKSALSRNGDEQEFYIIWAPVATAGWNLVFALPVADILGPAYAARDDIERLAGETARDVDRRILIANLVFIAFFLVIILFVVWLTARVSGRITEPISSLTKQVERVGDGNLVYTSRIHTGDEVEELSRSFERMTAELQKYIENLAKVTADKERIATELNVATRIQASMLPCIFPPFPNRREFDIYASMLPAREVGGDFYDFFLIDENTLAVVMADVSGKGVPAALFMVIAKTLIKNNACSGKSPGEVFETVNNTLCENNEEGMFVTAFMGFYHIRSGRFVYVNAGHNLPLIKKGGGDYEFLRAKPSFILAGMEDMAYEEEAIALEPGDTLFLYTDGVTEAVNKNLELFSDSRLTSAANRCGDLSVKEQLAGIKKEIDAFAEGAEQADDITMLALRINEQAARTGQSKQLPLLRKNGG